MTSSIDLPKEQCHYINIDWPWWTQIMCEAATCMYMYMYKRSKWLRCTIRYKQASISRHTITLQSHICWHHWLEHDLESKFYQRSLKEEHNYLCAQYSHGSTELLYPSQSLLINCIKCSYKLYHICSHSSYSWLHCVNCCRELNNNITKKPLIPLNLYIAYFFI